MKKVKDKKAGFNLVEISIAVMVAGILMAAALTAENNYLLQEKISVTKARMAAIDAALVRYADNNSAFPCVASLTDPVGSATYGTQVTDCSIIPAGPISSLPTGISPGTYRTAGSVFNTLPSYDFWNRTGAVPVRTIGLPDQYMMDAWGSRFVYRVSERQTIPTSIASTAGNNPCYSFIGYYPSCGTTWLVDTNVNVIPSNGNGLDYLLISLGPNQVGGYDQNGVQNIPCFVGTVEGLNCLYFSSWLRDTSMYSENGAHTFDDILLLHASGASWGDLPQGAIVPFITSSLPPAGCSGELPAGMWGNPTVALTAPLPLGYYTYCQKLY